MDFDKNKKILTEEEEKIYSKQFKKIWECKGIDRRSKIFFKDLNQEEEKIVLAELTNFIIYYFQNKDIVDKFIKSQSDKINDWLIIAFWFNQIGKAKNVENILSHLSSFADCVSYFEKEKKYIKILSSFFKGQNIYRKELFRTEETAQKLYEIYRQPFVYREIITYMEKNNIDADHISEKIAQRILQL